MLIDVFDDCFDNEKYSDNGINFIIHRCIPDNEITLKFEDDGGKKLFEITMQWKKFKEMIKRVED